MCDQESAMQCAVVKAFARQVGSLYYLFCRGGERWHGEEGTGRKWA